MKDFYDVYHLLQSNNFQKDMLQEAIIQTFRKRQTIFKTQHPLFNQAFATDEKRLLQWQVFLRKMKLEVSLDFQIVMKAIRDNLLPFYEQV